MTPHIFRTLVLANIGVALAAGVAEFTLSPGPEPIASTAELGAIDIVQIALVPIVVVVGAVTYLGLLRFRHWAPIAAVFLTVAGFAFIPLAEPIEQHAVVTMLVEFGTMLWGAVLACVYWSPIRRRFGLT